MSEAHNDTDQTTSLDSPYFYAGDDAAFYDDTVLATDRAYDLVHDVTNRVLRFALNERANTMRAKQDVPALILDVGCGTGAEAMRLLADVPDCTLLCIDSSAPMLDCFRSKVRHAYGSESAGGRITLAQADFREPGWLDRVIAEHCPTLSDAAFDAALSVYALHHLTPETKGEVYAAIAARLPRSALFINADLFSFETSWLANLAQTEEEEWIRTQFEAVGPGSDPLRSRLGASRTRLKEAWITHLRDENIPLPLGGYRSAANTLGEIREEDLLRAAGFATIEIVARLYQSAVAVAVA